MKMALLSSTSSPTKPQFTTSFTSPSSKPHHTHKPYLLNLPTIHKRTHLFTFLLKATTDNGAGPVGSVLESPSRSGSHQNEVVDGDGDGGGTPIDEKLAESSVKKFDDPRWVNGTWDLKQFEKNGVTNWDAVIDAEAKRRKWLEKYPESTNNNEPVIFDTSIIPWWAWMKRFHLPEAELLNGRAAMVGFFMAYLVDSLTGIGVVDQMSNFFCKTLLFVAVVGVLFIRKNEDVDNLKKLFEETTFYDKQWQATWQDETKKD